MKYFKKTNLLKKPDRLTAIIGHIL